MTLKNYQIFKENDETSSKLNNKGIVNLENKNQEAAKVMAATYPFLYSIH